MKPGSARLIQYLFVCLLSSVVDLPSANIGKWLDLTQRRRYI